MPIPSAQLAPIGSSRVETDVHGRGSLLGVRIDKEILRRFLVIGASALWVGSLPVYAEIVIPVASDVLGSHREVGFITRRVTVGLNLLGVLMVAMLGWDLRVRCAGRRAWIAWCVVVLAQGFLFVWHPVVDGLLDPDAGSVNDEALFYMLHRVYLWTSILQWVTAVGLGWHALAGWRRMDRAG